MKCKQPPYLWRNREGVRPGRVKTPNTTFPIRCFEVKRIYKETNFPCLQYLKGRIISNQDKGKITNITLLMILLGDGSIRIKK